MSVRVWECGGGDGEGDGEGVGEGDGVVGGEGEGDVGGEGESDGDVYGTLEIDSEYLTNSRGTRRNRLILAGENDYSKEQRRM